jgi:hypothetical protein
MDSFSPLVLVSVVLSVEAKRFELLLCRFPLLVPIMRDAQRRRAATSGWPFDNSHMQTPEKELRGLEWRTPAQVKCELGRARAATRYSGYVAASCSDRHLQSAAGLGSCQWHIKRPASRLPAVWRCFRCRLDAPEHAPNGPGTGVIARAHQAACVPGFNGHGAPPPTAASPPRDVHS